MLCVLRSRQAQRLLVPCLGTGSLSLTLCLSPLSGLLGLQVLWPGYLSSGALMMAWGQVGSWAPGLPSFGTLEAQVRAVHTQLGGDKLRSHACWSHYPYANAYHLGHIVFVPIRVKTSMCTLVWLWPFVWASLAWQLHRLWGIASAIQGVGF